MATAKDWISAAKSPIAPVAPPEADDTDESPLVPLVVLPRAAEPSLTHPLPSTAAVLDLGDKDCGDGPLEMVAYALRQIPAGSGLVVQTANRDVVVALLVWCRLAGHYVVEQDIGRFLIVQIG